MGVCVFGVLVYDNVPLLGISVQEQQQVLLLQQRQPVIYAVKYWD